MTKQFQYTRDLAQAVAKDPELQQQISTNPVSVLTSVADNPLKTDVWIYRIIVLALSSVILAMVIDTLVQQQKPAESVVALASTALGALAGLLAPSPIKQNG